MAANLRSAGAPCILPISGNAHRAHRNRAMRFRDNSDDDRRHSSPRVGRPGSP